MICAEISLGVSKYLNLSRSNRPENGTPPENSRTMAESTDVGAPKDFQYLWLKMFKGYKAGYGTFWA